MFDYADKIVMMDKGRVDFYGGYDEMMKIESIRSRIAALKEAKTSTAGGVVNLNLSQPLQSPDLLLSQKNSIEIQLSSNGSLTPNQRFSKLSKRNTNKVELPSILEEEKAATKQLGEVRPINAEVASDQIQPVSAVVKPETKKQFFFEEDKAKGSLSLKVVHRAIQGSGGYIFFLFTYFVAPYSLIWGFGQVRQIVVKWGNIYTKSGVSDLELMNSIRIWFVILGVFGFIRRFTIYIGLLFLGRELHAKMIFRVLHAKLNEFLKRVPMGQILNRFSNDIDVIDKETGDYIYLISTYIPKTLLNIWLISDGVENPYLVIPPLLFIVIALWLRSLYMNAKREVTRLFQITRSPVIGLASSCILGAPVIRCIGNQRYLQNKIDRLIDENSKNRLTDVGLDAWFVIQMNIFDFFIVQIPCYCLLLYTLYYSDIQTDEEYTKLTLFLQILTEFVSDLSILLNRACITEARFISIERCQRFEEIEPEQGYKFFERDAKIFEIPQTNLKLPNRVLRRYNRLELFKSGEILIKNISARYPTAKKNVLTNLNLLIKAGQKIGVVGRTGAGKSSFIKLLWRGLNPTQGQIFVDGQDITNIDLKLYRDQITLISQQTNLFEGSIAENISPVALKRHEVRELEKMLRKLKFSESKLEIKDLRYHLETDASNLSEGEKQVVSYVRGVFNRRRIVILDEASAYVDNETENGFKELAESAFQDSTVFIIAHRVQTVIGCDKILVLGDGRVIEFDSPGALLGDPESEFYKICQKG